MTAIAAIHVARKQLGLDEDTTRDLYGRITGKRSLRDMSSAERELVIAELRRQGFNKSFSGVRKPLEGKFAKKLQALWIAGWNLGVVDNRDDHALLAFVKRQTGVDHVRFLRDQVDADKAIEALKGWLAREARVDWSIADKSDWLKNPGAQIAIAQWNILFRAGEVTGAIRDFYQLVREAARPVDQMRPADWSRVMNLLGERIRKVKR